MPVRYRLFLFGDRMNNELVSALQNVTDAFAALLRMVGEPEPERAPVVMAARAAIAKAQAEE